MSPLQELKTEIMDRTGLGEKETMIAVALVMDTLKSRLPDAIAAQLDGVLIGEEFSYKEIMDRKLDEMKDSIGDQFNDVKKTTQGLMERFFQKEKKDDGGKKAS